MKPADKAEELLANYPGPMPVYVERIAEQEGLEVVEWDFQVL